MSAFGLVSPFRSLLFSAFRAGSLVAFGLFSSSRSPSGFVLRLSFARFAPAASFARRWSARLGVVVACRRSASFVGGAWVVSVPVSVGSSRCPGRGLWVWCGGRAVSGFVSLVASSGFGWPSSLWRAV